MSTEFSCRECTSCMPQDGVYQTWRRHFGLLAAMVSFFLATVSAFGIIVEPVREMLRPETATEVTRVGVTTRGGKYRSK